MAAARSEPDLVTGVAVQRAGGRRAEHPLLASRQRPLVLCPYGVITPLAVLHHGLSSLMGGMNGGARKRSGYFSPGRRCPGMTPASAHRFGGRGRHRPESGPLHEGQVAVMAAGGR
jgi:hypothetical protein